MIPRSTVRFCSEALRSLGIEPVIVESGPDAVEWIQRRSFDVVFMDCSMPGMDGFAAAAEIRAVEKGRGDMATFIVALTAHTSGPDAERWRTAGMNAYVAKPFTIESLTSVLTSIDAPSHSKIVARADGDVISTVPKRKSFKIANAEFPTLTVFRVRRCYLRCSYVRGPS